MHMLFQHILIRLAVTRCYGGCKFYHAERLALGTLSVIVGPGAVWWRVRGKRWRWNGALDQPRITAGR